MTKKALPPAEGTVDLVKVFEGRKMTTEHPKPEGEPELPKEDSELPKPPQKSPRRWTGLALVALILVGGGLGFSGFRFFYQWNEAGDSRFAVEFDPNLVRAFSSYVSPTETSEDLAGAAEHLNIISSIIGCLKLPGVDYESLPVEISKQFAMPQRLTRRATLVPIQRPEVRPSIEDDGKVVRVPGYFRSITQLSRLASDRRGQLAASMQSSRLLMQQLQVAAIIIGILTTILVGIKSGARNPRALDIAAIVSAAIGTGVASLLAFYNPREEYIRTARAIAQLSQLQTQISFALASEKACDHSDPVNGKLLAEWYSTFAMVSSASEDFGGPEPKRETPKN